MSEYVAKEFEVGGLTVKIIQDEDAANPREEWDNFGKIVHWHRRYDFGERITDPEQWLRDCPKGSVVLPVALLDHSGLHIWVSGAAHWSDPGGWDSGQVGWIYATPEMIREEYSVKRITREVREKVVKLLTAEIECFDQYLRGDVYGFVVEDEDGHSLDSCWGFFGVEYCEQEARSVAEHANKSRASEACLI